MQVVLAYAIGILSNTPLWVNGLFALLVWLGTQSLKPRIVALRHIAIVPTIFILWGLSGLANKPFPADMLALLWLSGFGGGGLVGLMTGPRLLAVERTQGRVHLPRSVWPLGRNMIVFFAHYGLNVAAAIQPGKAEDFLHLTVVVSGIGAGYFAGWGIALWRRYRRALVPATASAG